MTRLVTPRTALSRLAVLASAVRPLAWLTLLALLTALALLTLLTGNSSLM